MAQVQMLEGLTGARAVIAVKRNVAGYCQASAFGPPGSGRASFKQLCREANLPLGVGKGKPARSGRTRGKEQTVMADMDFPPLEDLGQDFGPLFFGLDQLITPEMMRAHVVSALAGGGGILVTANILERIDWLADKPKAKAGAAILLGILGGRLLWNQSRDAAMGLVGGVSGIGVAKLVSDLAGMAGTMIPSSLSAVEVTNTPMPQQFFSATRGPVHKAFFGPGMAQPIVTDDDPLALSEVEVTADQLSSWIG